MATVTLENVSKSFDGTAVLEDLNLEVRDREFMVLVGPSGCGKSTALRLIAGLENPTSGRIAIGERVVNDVPPKDRDIAMVFQNYALYPHMTVRENLEFGLTMRRTPRPEVERRVGEAASVLGLGELLDRRPKQLSGGQRQRVAVGRAIVRQPSVFLFDEPLSNLDARLRVQMRAEIKTLQQRLQTTTVYVTHDQIEAMTMGSRIAVMRGGRIQQIGTPLEVYERPRNLFVAGFLGSPPMNVFRAEVGPGGETLSASGFTLPVPAGWRAAAAKREGRAVAAGLRPENLRAARGSDGSARVDVAVEFVEPLGDEVVVHGRAGDVPLVSRIEPSALPAPGARIPLAADLSRLHLFDAETEQRLEPEGIAPR
jgi:multiple sugar transport system ATP-binding protein